LHGLLHGTGERSRKEARLATSDDGGSLRTLYKVLGLRPEARNDEIKAAFRKLAKTYHPDRRPADKRAETRFKEINAAYAILSDWDTRTRYDAGLSQRRSLRRQRVRKTAGTMAASFALTVTVTSAALLWRQQGTGLSVFLLAEQWTKPSTTIGPRGLEHRTAPLDGQRAEALARMRRSADPSSADVALVGPRSLDLGQGAAIEQGSRTESRIEDHHSLATEHERRSTRGELSLSNGEGRETTFEIETHAAEERANNSHARAAHPVQTDIVHWASYRSARFGFTVEYPPDIFVFEPAQSDEHVTRFRSRDGRAALRIFGTPNLAGRTLTQYRAALIQERYAKATLDYAPQRPTWFVLSGFSGDDIFYERVTFACDKRSFHGWMLVFPASERLLYDRITEEMHRKYRHSNGPRASCGAAKAQVWSGRAFDAPT
jgi:curved DNA-binding protein CbpA